MPRIAEDLSGKRFGRLVVVERKGHNLHGVILWLCQCDCGKHWIVRTDHLRSGKTRSCGCLYSERNNYKKSRTKEYRAWRNMIQRCTNPQHRDYKDYGGRGITVCERWLREFDMFMEDMGTAPSKELSLDRINNDLGYSPENCKWSTAKEQANNKRNSKLRQER